jgi:hypothetical protein
VKGRRSGAAVAFLIAATALTAAADAEPVPGRVADTPADRFGVPAGEELQLSAGSDDKNVTLRLALPTGPSQADSFSLVLATPIAGLKDAKPASLDALANGSRLTLRWGHFGLAPPQEDPVAHAIAVSAMNACQSAEGQDSGACRDSGHAIHKYDLPEYRRYLVHTLPTGATDYGIDASVGINDFDWSDPRTLIPQHARHSDWSVAGHIDHYLPGLVLSGSVAYQRAYKAADEQLLCPAATTNPSADCKMGRAAAPSRKESLLFSGGLRYRFTKSDGTLMNLAVAPLVTFDAIHRVWGVDVPVYFIPEKDGSLTGGIRFGYRSDRRDKFSVSAFVGTTFNILQ